LVVRWFMFRMLCRDKQNNQRILWERLSIKISVLRGKMYENLSR
jgi:hypothetical protein